ncbi:noroxomaritidine synthase-like [Zingiber officinale]|uniref:Uncharacterized protein n=1 Tax=Zingiber officinale TaxID=94328 RepID=A0A8J5HGV7_ZINOF|nr:noroxomaritidine synthase-like [Zingiber officinale]KAG6527021.1 hypothetical protein ZIOFF_009108 [Zingiber officinale]
MGRSWIAAGKFLLLDYADLAVSFSFFFFFGWFARLFRRGRRDRMPLNWPVVGMLPGALLNLHRVHDWAVKLHRRVGYTFWFRGPWFLGMDYLCTADPANVHHIFGLNFSNYPKGSEFAEIFDILGDGIFNSDGEAWKAQRSRAHAVVSSRPFRAFVADSIREKVAADLLPLAAGFAERGAVLDLQDFFLRLTFDATCTFVFGVDPRCLSAGFPTVPFARAIDDAMGAIFLRHAAPRAWWKLMKRLNVGEEKKLAAAREEIDRFINQTLTEKRIDKGSMNLAEKADLLSSYIINNSINEGDGGDSDDWTSTKFLRDTALNFMLAGRDTTGTAITWFFWMLSENPEVESKILEELKELRRSSDDADDDLVVFDAEEVGKLVYLHAALCETLRLYPSVPFEHKSALRDDVLPSGHKVAAGTKVLLSAYTLGRLEGVWGEDSAEFRPERWISEKGKVKHEPTYKFLSFNSGARTCLGKEVAFVQMKTVAAAMVYNFQVQVVEGAAAGEPKLSIILQMKGGLPVKLKRRTMN